MRHVQNLAAALAALTAGACASPNAPIPQASDAAFLRGCWVAKDEPGGRVAGFLRLLPDGPDGDSYRGDFRRAADGYLIASFRFARDGSAASFRYGWAKDADTYKRSDDVNMAWADHPAAYIVWDEVSDSGARLEASVENEQLAITEGADGISARVFSGERDGCD
jgi:hypothetical protein